MQKIEGYLKFIPLASLLLILASSIKLAVYYSVFNIQIVDYLSISEYIPLFINDIHRMLYVITTALLGFIIAILTKSKKDKDDKNEKKDGESKNVMGRRYFYIVVSILLIIVTCLRLYYNYNTTSEKLEYAIGPFFLFMLCLFMIFTTYEDLHLSITFSWLILLITAPIILNGYQDAYTILDNREKVVIKAKLKKENSNYVSEMKYIGKSNNFIFLFDLQNKKSIIKPIDVLEEIEISEKDN